MIKKYMFLNMEDLPHAKYVICCYLCFYDKGSLLCGYLCHEIVNLQQLQTILDFTTKADELLMLTATVNWS